MKHALIAVLFALSGCASAGDPQPLPGSLTYGGKVLHSPIVRERWSRIPFLAISVTVCSRPMSSSRMGRSSSHPRARDRTSSGSEEVPVPQCPREGMSFKMPSNERLTARALIPMGARLLSPSSLAIECCTAVEISSIPQAFTTDPVRSRVALLAADPPDNAKPACHHATARKSGSGHALRESILCCFPPSVVIGPPIPCAKCLPERWRPSPSSPR